MPAAKAGFFITQDKHMALSPQQVIEIAKCKKDPVYFMETYCRVQNPIKGLVPFKLYDFQKDIIRDFLNHRFIIVNKSRQVGLSTLTSNYALWLALFHTNKSIIILSIKEEDAKEFLKKIKVSFEGLPKWLADEPVVSNVHTLELSSGSVISSVSSGSSAARGRTPSLLIIDEAAFIQNMEDIWTSSWPTLCLAPDTLVLTNKGIQKIGDMITTSKRGEFVDPHEEQLVHDGDRLCRVTKHYVTKKTKVLQITTKLGTVLKVTPDHKMLTQDGWKPARDLVPGKDHLKRVIGTEIYGDNHLDPDEAYRLGGYIAEGWAYYKPDKGKYMLSISNVDKEFRDVFLRDGWRARNDSNHKIRIASKAHVERYIEYGIDPNWKCDTKEVPRIILQADKETQCHFLAGLIDGDGYVGKNSILLASTSRKLLQQVQLMLFNMGIWANITEGQPPEVRLERDIRNNRKLPQGTLPKSYRRIWCLKIPRSCYGKVASHIHLRIERKRRALIEYRNSTLDWSDRLQSIPLVESLRDLIRSVSHRKWRYEYGVRVEKPLKNNKITVTTALKIYQALGKEPDFLVDPKAHWDMIVDICESEETETYDFTVEPSHKFLQNGLVGSNSRGGSAILISTPNGIGNIFYDLWKHADPELPPEQRNSFHRIFVHWTQVPDYRGFEPDPDMSFEEIVNRARQNEWYRKMRPQFDDRRWAQEFEGDFLGSGNTVVPGERLKVLETKIKLPIEKYTYKKTADGGIEYIASPHGELWIWERPQEGKQYILSADIASGAASDLSAAYVIDMLTGNHVAELHVKANTMTMAYLLAELGHWYNTALIVPEITGIGWGTTQKLVYEIGYPNVFKRIDPQKPTKSKKDIWGWQTNAKTKPTLISTIVEYFSGDIEYISKRLWQELATFVWKSADKAEAEHGNNDDLVMAFAIGQYARKVQLMREPLTVAMIRETYEDEEQPPPILTTSGNMYDEDITSWLLDAWRER